MVKARTNFTLDPKVLDAARRKSEETGISVSFVVQRALEHWVETGEISPAPAVPTPKTSRQKGGAKTKEN